MTSGDFIFCTNKPEPEMKYENDFLTSNRLAKSLDAIPKRALCSVVGRPFAITSSIGKITL